MVEYVELAAFAFVASAVPMAMKHAASVAAG